MRKRTSSGERRPVLGGERVRRDVLDAHLDGAGDDVEQRRLPRGVTRRPRQPAGVRPPAVAVHDDATCRGTNSFGMRRGRVSPLRVRAGVGPAFRPSRPSGASAAGARGGTGRNAATRPLPSPRCRSALASATAQSPASSAASSANVSGAGAAAPGRPARAADGAARRDRERGCGPGLPAARAVREAGRPAGDRRARAAGTSRAPAPGAWSRGASAFTAPTSSQYCCNDGSRSASTSRSAVSSMTVPAV